MPQTELKTRKSERITNIPKRFTFTKLGDGNLSEAYLTIVEPNTLEEALNGPDSYHWKKAIDEELGSLAKNETWTLSPLPEGRKAIDCKWVFKVKFNKDGSIEKYKARLVAKGYSQVEGLDYDETFAPVVKIQSLRTILAIANEKGFILHQMDVKTAFLYGNLDEEIYMKQPAGAISEKHPDLMCKLKKSIYGLKQSPRQWNKRINNFFGEFGFVQNEYDPCVYHFNHGSSEIIVGVYVDDLVIASSNLEIMEKLKQALHSEFEMKDLGELKYLLGMEVEVLAGEVRLCQQKYVRNVLVKFGMDGASRVKTPMEPGTILESDVDNVPLPSNVPYREVIGSLNYLMTCTRPDIATSISMVSRFLNSPTRHHWKCVKRILRYLVGTIGFGIRFVRTGSLKVTAYSDADWAGDEFQRKSRTGFVVMIGSGPVIWTSRLQDTIALSSTEAEYIALNETAKDVIWISNLMKSLNCGTSSAILVDNVSAINLA